MTIETQAIYINGALHPVAPLPLKENQQVELTISEQLGWLDNLLDHEFVAECQQDSQEAPSLEEVRAILSCERGTLSAAVSADRDEMRF